MVDPISTARGIYQTTAALYTFITIAKVIDSTTKALYDEIATLNRTASTVESVLQRPELQAFHDAELWTVADKSLKVCAISLERLEDSC